MPRLHQPAPPWNTVPAPYGIPPCKNAVFTQVWTTWGQSKGGSAGGLGGAGPEGLKAALGKSGAGSSDVPTTPSPSPWPQVYEGLKPSDKYEKPLDYRYGLGQGTTHGPMSTHTLPLDPQCYPSVAPTPGWTLGWWVILSPSPCKIETYLLIGGPCAMTSGGSVNSLQKASLTKVRP